MIRKTLTLAAIIWVIVAAGIIIAFLTNYISFETVQQYLLTSGLVAIVLAVLGSCLALLVSVTQKSS